MPKPAKPRPVAPNLPNTLAPALPRLPLGQEQDDPAQLSVWRIWIPTNTGGTLRVTQTADSILSLRRPATNVLATGKGVIGISYVVPDGTCGDFYLTSSGDAGTITATFVQIAWSRQSAAKDAAPLLPWNFYYWPSQTGDYFADRAKQVIGHYATSVGRSASEFSRWEEQNHQKPDAEAWAGHCHNAAPASVLFEPPVAVTVGEHLAEFPTNDEEMKFLAAEFFGNFGLMQQLWKLEGITLVGEYFLPAYLKPGVAKTKAALVHGLADEFDEDALSKATELLKPYRSESDFAHAVDVALGKMAAQFFTVLLAQLRGNGEPIVANARSYDGGDGAGPVWNQVFFYYTATYTETPNSEDDRDITVTCSLYSNLDRFPSANPPATISRNGTVTPGRPLRIGAKEEVGNPYTCQIYKNVWRIIFNEDGTIDDRDPRCAWKQLKNENGEELYAPTLMTKVARITRRRQSNTPYMLGNPVVGQELLMYLKIRKRYQ